MRNRRYSRLSVVAVFLMVVTAILGACGDNTATPVATTASATTAAATTAAGTTKAATTAAAGATTAAATTAAAGATTAAATTAAATAAVASSGHPGIYREVWFGPDPTTLDPQAVQPAGYTTRYMYGNLYIGLSDYDEKANIIPGIAKEWKVSADNKVWTFTLNPAAKFSSGRQVTAADVAYTYERAADSKLKSTSAYSTVSDIVGAAEKFAGTADKISGIKVIDDTTIELTLKSSVPFLPSKLASSAAFILNKDIVESDPKWWETKSAGAGPFQLAEWQHGQQIALTPNPNWFGSKVKLTRIEYLLVGDATNRLSVFESGKTDAHWSLLTDEINRLKKDTGEMGKMFKQWDIGMGYILYVGMNANGYEPFKNAKVRQAVTMALDSQAINDTPLNGAGFTATGLIPSGLPGYVPGQMKLKYDPTAAKKLLADAGYADASKMPELVLSQVGSGPDIAGTTQFIQEALKTNLGMNVRINVTDQQSFIAQLQQGKVAAWASLMIASLPDQYSVLSQFSSKNPQNVFGYNNPEYDALLQQALTISDDKARNAVYNQLETKLMDDAAIMPVMWAKFYTLQRPYVSGLRVNVLGIMPYTNLEVK
ncbi:MAG: peptide ABC transporter substrate-binding protein [Chloroflexi bacterium]|uniref:Peptide ABC transporter substrate-binding protein n=1 Tax=Candidatus Chlorohelix allophototropha TaxID=3003348 RepID=A0A8T7M1D4_9CHLR|nr:peptide ABC transporter substrate-binding protein [Chloroflexota bacterium]WJW67743.1 peptide ABC transporter substrate-binding protein [Chloroflexota bacterium L227-S17]